MICPHCIALAFIAGFIAIHELYLTDNQLLTAFRKWLEKYK